MGKTRLALIQMKMSSEKKKNISSSISKIYKAKKKGAEIICLPELFLTNYFCQTEKHSNFNFAEKIPGPTTDMFSLLAKNLEMEQMRLKNFRNNVVISFFGIVIVFLLVF